MPFLVQALIVTEPITRGGQCLKHTMSELLAMALPSQGEIEKSFIVMVLCYLKK